MEGMISFVLALVLLLIGLLGVATRKVYNYLPAKELKRQAEDGSVLARKLWRAVSYGSSLQAYLWLWIGLAAAGGFVLLARVVSWPVSLIVTVGVIWLAFAWFPARPKVSGLEARLAQIVTPLVAWQLQYLHGIFDRLLSRRQPHYLHTNLYEAADLLELLEKQQAQTDNRISSSDLERAKQALTAHRYTVSEILMPRQEVKTVHDSDTIGLVMLDELHTSGQSSFPVCAGKSDNIIGTLYLHDLGLKTEGRVGDYMQPGVQYLHEDDTLDQALQAFYKTRQQSFIVVNSFEEYVGIATLETIIRHLIGTAHADDFDQHHDIAAVAAKHLHDDEAEAEPEITEVTAEPDEVAVPAPEDELALAAEDEPAAKVVHEDDDFTVTEENPDVQPVPAGAPSTTAPVETAGPTDELAEEPDEAEVDPDSLTALDLPEDKPEPADKSKE